MKGTRRGEEGSGQFEISGDVSDLFHHIHQSPYHWRDPPVTQYSARREGERGIQRQMEEGAERRGIYRQEERERI